MGRSFFNHDQQKSIISAIKEAEINTSGEIQVHIENHCRGEALDRAVKVFGTLKMHKTKERNGVLFYLAVKDKKFAILGDSGINKVVAADFWECIKDMMTDKFKNGEFTEALCQGIKDAGNQLKTHFPYQTDDINELPDEISFGKE